MARFLQLYESCVVGLDRSIGAKAAGTNTNTRAVQWMSERLAARAEAENEARLMRECFGAWVDCPKSARAVQPAPAIQTATVDLPVAKEVTVRSGSVSGLIAVPLGVSRSASRSSSLSRPEDKASASGGGGAPRACFPS